MHGQPVRSGNSRDDVGSNHHRDWPHLDHARRNGRHPMIGKILERLIWGRNGWPRSYIGCHANGIRSDPWIARNALGRKVRFICEIVGHDPQGRLQPAWSTSGPFIIPPGDPRTADYTAYDWTNAKGE